MATVKPGQSCQYYLAAPFFNGPQTSLVRRIQNKLNEHNVSYFSPYEHSVAQPDAGQAECKKTFDDNLLGIEGAQMVLAVMDYLLPEDQEAMVVAYPTYRQVRSEGTQARAFSMVQGRVVAPLNQPDMGVVYEMGYARGIASPVVGFFPGELPKNLNLMLAQTMKGYIQGMFELEAILINGFSLQRIHTWKRPIV